MYTRREELISIREQYAVVDKYYHELVREAQTISHEDFWQRYFYRCYEARIVAQWERQAAAKSSSSLLSSVTATVQKVVETAKTTATPLANEVQAGEHSESSIVPASALDSDDDDEMIEFSLCLLYTSDAADD